ncbi:hypothetical protein BDN70DRAFT_874337 [Pholiota conissans]|uniref:N-acetyltransferase domain-containing protein n=1 Tax=Pholiota conissans TaxID=109636 RepID=A0A9P5Z977_9AGAR|nr:hypothetical protein BDN70DRAFT_874337 [Pholiota conissans]
MDEEAQPLTTPIIRPERLRFAHLWKAAKTYENAFEFDPYTLYLKADGKSSPAPTRARNLTVLGLWSIKDIFLTVNGGSALMVAFPNFFGEKTPFERFIDTLWVRILETGKKTEEQAKRAQETNEKSKAALDATIRDRLEDMIFLGLLATEPASQGKGYGGALLEAINDYADKHNKAMWLTSSNILNEPFYNSHGFKAVATFYMGDGNPAWTEKPIPIQLMVREAKNKSESRTSRRPNASFKHLDPTLPLRSLV